MARVKSGTSRPVIEVEREAPSRLSGDERQGHVEPSPPSPSLDLDTAVASWDVLEIPVHDRHVYQASALGRCHAALVAAALGVERAEMPGVLQSYLDEGSAAEARILEMLHGAYDLRAANYQELATLREEGVIAGYNPEMHQVQTWLEVGSSALIRSHPDEVVRVNSRGVVPAWGVVEAKAFGPSNWKKWTTKHAWGDFDGYAWQVSAQHHSTGLPVYFVVGRKDRDEIDAGDAGSVSEIDVLLVTDKTVPYSMAQLKARVLKAEVQVKSVERGTGDIPPCEKGEWPCAFFREEFCLGKPDADEAAYEDVDDVGLGGLLALHYAYGVDMQDTQEQKDAKKERDKVKERIDKHLSEKGYARGKKLRVWSETGDEYEFEWVQVPVSAKAYVQNYPKIKLVNAGEYVQEDAGV